LPLIQCIILETLRTRTPAPLSIPHATSKDDVYKDWLIPENTTVVINVHAIHLDPKRYPEPEKFIPERHMTYVLNSTEGQSHSIYNRPHLGFSTGRRVCVGIHLAERSLFMAFTSALACFRFERESDVLIDIDNPKDVRSLVFSPKPYKIRLVPRDNGISRLL
ncbi:cytochrome P450, partial [Spinellus fusiger]